MMNILVTGGAGFIGQYVVRDLLESNFRVTVFDNFSSNKCGVKSLESLGATVVVGDVTDPVQVRSAFETGEFFGSIHLAADRSVQSSIAHPDRSLLTNAFGSYNVFVNAARNGCKKIVFASSAAVYGDISDAPASEAIPTAPLSPYGIEKLASEHYLRNVVSEWHIEGTALRLFNVFGAGDLKVKDSSIGVVSEFVYQAAKHGKVTIHGSGQQTRDFVHVEDVSRAVLSALDSHLAGFQILNVGSGRAVSVLTVAEIVRSAYGGRIPIEYTGPREGDIMHSLSCTERIAEMLGWSAQGDVEEKIYAALELIAAVAQSDCDKSNRGCDAF